MSSPSTTGLQRICFRTSMPLSMSSTLPDIPLRGLRSYLGKGGAHVKK